MWCEHEKVASTPPRLEQTQGADIDLLVAPRRRPHGILAPRERRRVENYHPEASRPRLELAQEIEGVAFLELGAIAQAVELQIAAREPERVGRRIEKDGVACPPAESVAGESAREAEGVEHPSPCRVTRHEDAVLRLVEIEPGLVPATRRDAEPTAVLGDHELRSRGILTRREALEARRRRFVLAVDAAVGEEPLEGRLDPLRRLPHAEGEALHHAHRAVAVHHEAGKLVGLAPAQAIGVGDEAGRPAIFPGRLEPAPEEFGVDGFIAPGEEPAAERGPGIVEALAEIVPDRVHHLDGLARPGEALEIGDLAPVDPRMPRSKPRVFPALENEPGHAGSTLPVGGR